MQTILALPAYNEQQALPLLFENLQVLESPETLKKIVIVDDGSTDATCKIIARSSLLLPIELVVHRTNRGLGETLSDALRHAAALALPGDAIVTMDADNTHSPALMREMIARLEDGCDVVIASRYRPGAEVVGLSAFRRLMSQGARVLFQLLFPIPGVRDYTSGFRAYRAEFLQGAFARYGADLVNERGFACMAELLLKSAKLGARCSEVPMILRYDLKEGASKMKVARTVWRTLRLMARARFSGGPPAAVQTSESFPSGPGC